MCWDVSDFFKVRTEVFPRTFSIKNNFHEFKMHHSNN